MNKSNHIFHPEDLEKDEDSSYFGTRVSEVSGLCETEIKQILQKACYDVWSYAHIYF